MQAVTAAVQKGSDPNIRPQNSDVLLRQRARERERLANLEREANRTGEATDFARTSYMLLISRIDTMLHQGRLERAPVEALARMLGERIAALTLRARRNLVDLPEVQAIGADNAAQLPRLIANRLYSGEETDAVLELLRSPSFAAAIRDESRNTTYGPRGMLRAS